MTCWQCSGAGWYRPDRYGFAMDEPAVCKCRAGQHICSECGASAGQFLFWVWHNERPNCGEAPSVIDCRPGETLSGAQRRYTAYSQIP